MRRIFMSLVISVLILGYGLTAKAATPLSELNTENKLQVMIDEDKKTLKEQLNLIEEQYRNQKIALDISDEEVEASKKEKIQKTVNTIGEAYLTVGFRDIEISTFNENKAISVEAPQGTTISVLVLNTKQNYKHEETNLVGASKMVDFVLPLEIGENACVIYTSYDGKTYIRLYKINRKEGELKKDLENLDMIELIKIVEPNNTIGD